MSKRFALYTASFTYAGPTTINLRQLTDQGSSSGATRSVVRPGGALDPGAHLLSNARPTFRFGTRDLKTVLDVSNVLSNGIYCSGGHVARYRQRAEGGSFLTSTSHFTQTTPRGFLHVTSIEVDAESQDGADMQLEYVALSDDGTSPVTEATDADFDAIVAPAYSTVFFMGGVRLGGTAMTGLSRVRVNPGIRYNARLVDGGVWPLASSSSIQSREPSIDLTFLDLEVNVDDVTDAFMDALGAAIDVYFWKATTEASDAAGGRVAVATVAHRQITAAAGSWGPEDITVTGDDDATTTIRVMPLALTEAESAIP